jgi:hypothetical protein
LKEIWEKETVFADEALARAAELLAIPDEAVFRGYEPDLEFQQNTIEDENIKVLHFRSILRPYDSIDLSFPEGPKLELASWSCNPQAHEFAVIEQGMTSENQSADTGINLRR